MLKDHWPQYLSLDEAQDLLARMGLQLSRRQIRRAAEKNASGLRKLPFFVDPIDKKLKIEKSTLLSIYRRLQVDAENNLRD